MHRTNNLKTPFLFSFIFLLFFLCILPKAANAKGSLRFQLDITDYYDPFLSPQENQQAFDSIINEAVTITGVYEPTRDSSGEEIKQVYHPDCMIGVTCFGGKWVQEKNYKEELATIISLDTKKHQVVFKLPKPTQTLSLAYKLIGITISTPSIKISIPYKKSVFPIQLKEISQRNLDLTNPDPDDRYPNVYLVSQKGLIAQLTPLDGTTTPGKEPSTFTEQEKKKMFSIRSFLDYDGHFHITIPENLPSWHQLNQNKDKFWQTKALLADENPVEVISLEGYVAYEPQQEKTDYYNRDENWIRSHGQLTHIYLNPVHIPDYGCDFIYGITFFPDGSEERYFAKDFSFGENIDDEIIQKKKIFLTQHDMSVLDQYEVDREQYYINQQKQYPGLKNGWLACKRMITDAKRLLSSPKQQLEQEFDQYKEIIQEADKKRRSGY